MIRRTLVWLTASAIVVLLPCLLAGCTDGRDHGAGQPQEASQVSSSASRTSTSEETTGGHQEAQHERSCSALKTRLAETQHTPDENSHLRIAYSRYHAGVLRIYMIDEDGTGQTRLTKASEANEVSPAWSPDGRKIAFETYTDYVYSGPYHVYVINADGSGRTQLAVTRGDAAGEYTTPTPAWAPDGKKIAFAADNGIHVIDADGSGEMRLTKADDEAHLSIVDRSPTWSPDGKKIAFSRQAIDTTNSDAVSSADPEAVPEKSGMYVINADGSGLRKLPPPGQLGNGSAPTWSPNSKKIAFVPGGYPDIFVTNAEGTCQSFLTNTPDARKTAPLWQPTGKKIAFATSNAIATINADGSSETLLDKTVGENTKELSAWSPDGKELVFLSAKFYSEDIHVIVTGGKDLTRLNSVVRTGRSERNLPLTAYVSVVFVSENGQ